MRDSIQAFSWYVRRGSSHEEAGYFYRDVIGLPLYGHTAAWSDWADRGAIFIFRAGAAIELEFLKGDVASTAAATPEEATIVPIFRSFDVDTTLARLVAHRTEIVRDQATPWGRTVHYKNPAGSIDAVREAARGSRDLVDQAAEREFLAGGARVNGIAAMPPEILDIGWIQLFVADVEKEVAFYRDILGIDVTEDCGRDGALLYLGDLGRLEISPGGRAETPVSDRNVAAEMWMLRVHGIDDLVSALDGAGVHWVNRPFEMTGGKLAYFTDPEGHLVGIQEHGNDGRVQEIEAEARWLAGTDKRRSG